MNFVAIDIETANNPVSSICQIGMVRYANGVLVDTYSSMVNPDCDFNKYNTAVHGITQEMVKDAPLIVDIYEDILAFAGNNILVGYSNFDKRSLRSCAEQHDLMKPNNLWVDANSMLKKNYPQYAKKGSNLSNVCRDWGFDFSHHDALEDAKACGFITARILLERNLCIQDWAAK